MSNNYMNPYQSQQYYFQQPQGNVYFINNSLEVANVPISTGSSVAICLSEGLMYIKTMQGGAPSIMVYTIKSYQSSNNQQAQQSSNNTNNNEKDTLQVIVEELKGLKQKLGSFEKELSDIKSSKTGGNTINELL